jgi:serine/threonine-protein kinase
MKTCPQCLATHADETTVCPTDGTTLVADPIWPEGTLVDHTYRIVAKIGEDVFCTVYKALHHKSGEVYTLNVMSWGLACDPGFVELFRQDAALRKRLHHPNVAHVEAIGEADDGRPFVVMEYMSGQSLKKYIQQDAPFAPRRACAIARQVASGLEAAHRLGMIHRDVKPESIYLIDGSDVAKIKLLGLGIARLKEALLGDRFRTSPEAVIGTMQYLSPEQALGQLGSDLDGRADLYSLGVVMYQMLTGELPFHATTPADWMLAHIQGIPTPIRVNYAHLGIPDPLTGFVQRCMSKSRTQRPASAREFIGELDHVEREIGRIEKARNVSPRTPQRHKTSGWKFWKT